jgi:hypothetical protein
MFGGADVPTSNVIVEPPVTTSSKTWTYVIVGIIMVILIGYFLYQYVYLPNRVSDKLLPCSATSCNPSSCNPSGSGLPNCDPTVCIPYACPLPACDLTTCKPAACNPIDSKLPSCNAAVCNPGTCPTVEPGTGNPGIENPDTENPSSPPPPPPVQTVYYGMSSKIAPNVCLRPANGKLDDGTAMMTANCAVDTDASERWAYDATKKQFMNADKTKCFDMKSYGSANDTPVIIMPCSATTTSQIWTNDDQNRYVNKHANKCLSVYKDNPCVGTSLVVNDCTNNLNQQFVPVSSVQPVSRDAYPYTNQTYRILQPSSGKCLRTPGGAYTQMWPCDYTEPEHWRFVDAGNGSVRVQNPSSGKCLTNNTTYLSNCNDGDNDRWVIQGDPRCNFGLKNVSNSQCIRAPNGDFTQLYPCDGASAEYWKVIRQ